MSPRGSRGSRASVAHRTEALLIARVQYGEADLIVTLLTRSLGRVSALARGARKSQRRFGGSLEPLHTLSVAFDERPGVELCALREATLLRTRTRLASDLDRMQAAGSALAWIRRAAPPRVPEPELWRIAEAALDALDVAGDVAVPPLLASTGLQLLVALGWGLDLDRCVSCARPCDAGRAAMIDPARGGLVCRSCGGAPLKLSGAVRERLQRATGGEASALQAADAPLALALVDATLAAHGGLNSA